MNKSLYGATAFALMLGLALSACKPNYPKCDSDDSCLEKSEVCVNGQCQECRDNNQCLAKYPQEKRTCHEGRCEAGATSCKQDSDCSSLGAGYYCQGHTCAPSCAQDKDCGTGKRCAEHKCVGECSQDSDCGYNHTCQSGQCIDLDSLDGGKHAKCKPVHPGDVVNLETVHFEFNKYDLSADVREQLSSIYECLKRAPANLHVVIEGHCDDRGTQEYNLALGEKRAQATLNYLKTLGADPRKLSVRSKGENEPLCTEETEECYNQNRRAQFIQNTSGR